MEEREAVKKKPTSATSSVLDSDNFILRSQLMPAATPSTNASDSNSLSFSKSR